MTNEQRKEKLKEAIYQWAEAETPQEIFDTWVKVNKYLTMLFQDYEEADEHKGQWK